MHFILLCNLRVKSFKNINSSFSLELGLFFNLDLTSPQVAVVMKRTCAHWLTKSFSSPAAIATRCLWICSTWLRSSYLVTGCLSSTPPFTPSSTRPSAATAPIAAVRILTRGRHSQAQNSAWTKAIVIKISIRHIWTDVNGCSFNHIMGRNRFATRWCSHRHCHLTTIGLPVQFLVASRSDWPLCSQDPTCGISAGLRRKDFKAPAAALRFRKV